MVCLRAGFVCSARAPSHSIRRQPRYARCVTLHHTPFRHGVVRPLSGCVPILHQRRLTATEHWKVSHVVMYTCGHSGCGTCANKTLHTRGNSEVHTDTRNAARNQCLCVVTLCFRPAELVLERNEAISLVNFLAKLSDSVETIRSLSLAVRDEQEQEAQADSSRAAAAAS